MNIEHIDKYENADMYLSHDKNQKCFFLVNLLNSFLFKATFHLKFVCQVFYMSVFDFTFVVIPQLFLFSLNLLNFDFDKLCEDLDNIAKSHENQRSDIMRLL
jgi:hypothetical protein